MMWNFLVGGLLAGAAIVLYDGQPDPERLWEFAARGGRHALRHERGLHRRVHEGGRRAAARCRRLRSIGSTGSPLPVEGFEWVYEQLPGRLALLDQRRHRPLHRVRGRLPAAAGLRRRAPGALPGRGGGGVDEDGRPLVDEVGELVITRADAVDAALLLERPGRRALPRELLRRVPGRLAPRRLDQDHRARHGGDLRALRLDDQPRRRPHGHERDLQRGRGRARACSTAWSWTSTDADAAVRRAARRRSTRRRAGRREIRRRVREHCSPRHVPDRIVQIAEVPRTLSDKKLEVPVKKILLGRGAGECGEPRLAGEPGRARLVRGLQVRAS